MKIELGRPNQNNFAWTKINPAVELETMSERVEVARALRKKKPYPRGWNAQAHYRLGKLGRRNVSAMNEKPENYGTAQK